MQDVRGPTSASSRRRLAALAPALVVPLIVACGNESPLPKRPNLVLVTVDTLRADHMQVYGHARPTTPRLARMAGQGVLFAQAMAQAPWTLPSMASVHSSLYPSQHGAVGGELALPEEAVTLAERLAELGYHTVAVVSHEFVGRGHGFAQGFEVFDESNVSGHSAVTSESLTRSALSLTQGVEEPFFLWVHYFDPHFTYVQHPEVGFSQGYSGELPPRITAKRLLQAEDSSLSEADLDFIRAVYDEEIAHTDEWIGELWDGLVARDGSGHVALVVTADHGEYFHERGRFFHGKDVYRELVHVPLLITGAIDEGLRGAVVDAPVETRSIPRTLLGLIGADDGSFGGIDLFEVPRAGGAPAVFSEGSDAFGEDERKIAVVADGWKLIQHLDDGRHELYHLESDPDERRDLWSQAPSEAPISALERRLEEFRRLPRLEPLRTGLDPETLGDLEDLGYAR